MSDLLVVAVVLVVLCTVGAAISLAEANDRVNGALAACDALTPPRQRRPANVSTISTTGALMSPHTADPAGSDQAPRGLAAVLAAVVGPEAAHHAAIEFAVTEAASGHVDCAREALRGLPVEHLRAAITGTAVVSHLCAGLLIDRSTTPADTSPARP
ncbi:hypothetical protein [Actinoplanes sp. NPDC026623]|uniref:hypothetical protein n=1 Tax=Actinoplanes sp. NPDC026623 TaxID=3155610 RepID=UPI0033DCC6F7